SRSRRWDCHAWDSSGRSGSLVLQLGEVGEERIDGLLVVVSSVRRAGQRGQALSAGSQIPGLIGQELVLSAGEIMESGIDSLKAMWELGSRHPASVSNHQGIQVHLKHIHKSLERLCPGRPFGTAGGNGRQGTK